MNFRPSGNARPGRGQFIMRNYLFERGERSDLLGVSGGERLEILGDPGLGGVSDGEGGHAAVTHPEHDRPAERGEGD